MDRCGWCGEWGGGAMRVCVDVHAQYVSACVRVVTQVSQLLKKIRKLHTAHKQITTKTTSFLFLWLEATQGTIWKISYAMSLCFLTW